MKSKSVWIIGSAGLAVVVAGVVGCSSSSDPAADSQASTPSASTSSSALDDGGCALADASGTTKNTAMQDVAASVYSSLDCESDTPLQNQLEAAAQSESTTQDAKAAGATVSVDSAAGGTVLKLVAGRSACQVTVLDNTDNKMMVCGDV